jgi:hypothetical protein
MKKLIYVALVAILFSACAPGPIGVWKYSVTGTPQGDYSGNLTISKAPTGYAAKMDGTGSEIAFNKFSFNKKTKQADGDFDFSGLTIFMSAKLNKDEMKGNMSTSGMEFSFSATRKK